ncbi:MAG TPA: GNAT family N-acetyltransferase [Gemmatimonadales bacterium]|nr:GNAT family N-acetyltransferase [Gemmatimonadales bacterium]
MHRIRLARLDDIDRLNALIAESAAALSAGYYSDAEIAALVTHVFGVDTQLLRDGTYHLIESDGRAVACGGWSRRRTLFGGDQAKGTEDPLLDPGVDAARIRAFFVHPSAARQGHGRALLQRGEAEARAAGFRRAELMSTLPGVPFYRALGYQALEQVLHPLPGGERVGFVRMSRELSLPRD